MMMRMIIMTMIIMIFESVRHLMMTIWVFTILKRIVMRRKMIMLTILILRIIILNKGIVIVIVVLRKVVIMGRVII